MPLVEIFIKTSNIGLSLNKSEVIQTVTDCSVSIGATHLFKNGEPTKN